MEQPVRQPKQATTTPKKTRRTHYRTRKIKKARRGITTTRSPHRNTPMGVPTARSLHEATAIPWPGIEGFIMFVPWARGGYRTFRATEVKLTLE